MQLQKYILKEIAEFNRSSLNKKDSINEIKYLDTSSIIENAIISTQALPRRDAPSRAQRKVKDETIIYSTVRPRLKHYGILSNPSDNLIVSSGFVTIDIKPNHKDRINAYYLYLLLTRKEITEHLGAIADSSTTSYPSINPSDIGTLEFSFPDFQVQSKIADVFRAIDEKIALNRSINQTLEAMAKQLYDYWFVQFDFPDKNGKPYKSSGGKMVWNEMLKREIPEGWEAKNIGSIIQTKNGGDWGIDDPTENCIKVKCIRGADIIELNNLPTRYISPNHKDKILSAGDIMIEVSGGSPTQATGRVALITKGVIDRNGGKITCSNFCQSISLINSVYSEYYYLMWKNLYEHGIMFNYEGKTSGIKNFQTDSFLSEFWFHPPLHLIELFHKIVYDLYNKRDLCIAENNSLIDLRDTLLPLLMNGQVTIKN